MLVVVKGGIDSLQPSIDFYIGIVGKGLSSPKEIRNKYFEVFKKEDSLRKENFLQYKEIISNDYLVSYDEEPLLVDGEEEYIAGSNFFANEEYPEDEEVYSADVWGNIVDSSYSENSEDEDEDEFITNSYEEIEEDDEFIDINYKITEDEIIEDNYKLVVGSEEEIIEDLNSDIITDTYIDGDDEFVDYSSSDNIISSLEKETINLENEKSSNFVISDSLEKEKVGLDKENNIDFIEYNYLEEENYMLDTEDNVFKEEKNNLEIEKNSNFSNSSIPSSDLSRESSFSEKSKVFDVSSGSYGGMFEEGTESVKRSENIKVDIEVPKDLRDFVKLHYNCEMSFALQYFSKKDIDKQLSLGRVFKRKNRLLI